MSLLSFRQRVRGLMPLVLALGLQNAALADDGCGPTCTTTCNAPCPCTHCPPCFRHCVEGPPKIKFKCGCGKPVCVPDCSTPNWGYFAACWRPWPGPVDYSHCPCGTPAAVAGPCGPACTVPGIPAVRPGEPIPPPQPVDNNVRQSL